MDYQKIVENLNEESIIKLMENLGADRYIEKEDCIIFPTICHNIDSDSASMKLYYYKNSHIFYCYTEDGAMSIFKLLKTYYENHQISYDWYEDIYKVITKCSNYEIKKSNSIKYESLKNKFLNKKKVKELTYYSNGLMEVFSKFYPIEWLEDGISKNTMDKYNIKFSISQNKIIIPHYDIKGNLIGIRGRALNEWEIENIGKYAPVQIEGKWYSHPLSLNLYGLNVNKNTIKKHGICYIGEAEKFVMQMEDFNMPNCSCAVCGSNFNKFQLNILMQFCHPKEIVLCFDKEEKENEDKYFMKLWNICQKYNNYCKFSFIYDRENLLRLKQSPTDCGEEIFKKLIERRVIVK